MAHDSTLYTENQKGIEGSDLLMARTHAHQEGQ